MKSKTILMCTAIGAIMVLLPEEVLAKTATDLITKDVMEGAEKIEKSIFGPVMYTVAVFGAGLAIFQAIMGNFKQLMVFGAVALTCGLMPKFLNSVFSLLIP